VEKDDGTVVLFSYSHDRSPDPMDNLPVGMHTLRLTIPPRSIAPGNYRVRFTTIRSRAGDTVVDDPGVICTFSLDDMTTLTGNNRPGYFSTILDWRVCRLANSAGLSQLASE
jgi:hypothetical protein